MRKFPGLFSTIVVAFGFLAAPASPTRAATLFVFGAGQPTGIVESGTFNIGNQFTVGAAGLSATEIGAYVGSFQSNGLTTTTFQVNLYNSSNQLLTSAIVPIGTPVGSQNFAYVPYINTLAANTTYTLTDVATNTDLNAAQNTPFGYKSDGGSAGTWNDVTFNQNRYVQNPSSPSQATVSNNGSFQEFLGGNLHYTAVPEPASLSLLTMSGVTLLARRRRA